MEQTRLKDIFTSPTLGFSCNEDMPAVLPALEVFYDGRCPLCAREMAHYIRADRAGRVRFTDLWQEPERLGAAGLDHDAAMALLHGRLGDGLLWGVPVFFEIWRRLPRWRWVARLLAALCRRLPRTA